MGVGRDEIFNVQRFGVTDDEVGWRGLSIRMLVFWFKILQSSIKG